MTNLEMLELIGNVKDGYIAQAQTHRVKKKPQETTRRSPSKLILIAATMVFLLTGCAYAVMKLQDLKVAEDSYTKSRDVYGNLIEPTEVTEDVIYPYAPAESPMQQAAREWHEYRESPDTPTQEDGRVPMNYYHTYHCANREMMAKLDEITEKYGLKLLETELLIQSYQKDILHEALGIQSVIRADAKAQVQEHYGGAYPNGTFTSSVFFTLEGEDAWELESFADFYYAAEGYFYPYYTYVTEDCQEWTYQTADGTTVLMVMYPDGRGKVFADGVGGSIMIDLDPGHLAPAPYPRDENDLPAKADLEQMADLFDYKVKPHGFDPDEVNEKLDQREAEHQEKMKEDGAKFEGYWALPECADYAEYLNTLNFLENTNFALVDLNEDGVQDLFLESGGMNRAMTIKDGKVEKLFEWLGKALPCEDGYYMVSDFNDIPGEESYYKLGEDGLENVEGFMFRDGIWRHGRSDVDYGRTYPISEEDAQAIRDKYTLLDLDMRSCAEFPMNGTTLGQIVAAEPQPDEGELRKLYAAFIQESDDYRMEWQRDPKNEVKYYELRDVTGDGQKDLLLSQDGETICLIASHYRGRIIPRTSMNYRLRAENVLESTSVGLFNGGSEITRHQLYQYRNNKSTDLGYFSFIRDTQSWINAREEPIPASDYENLAAKYPIVDIDFKPIEELIGS